MQKIMGNLFVIGLTFAFCANGWASDEEYRELKNFNAVETGKSDQAGKCILKVLRNNLEKLGAVSEKLKMKDVSFESVIYFEGVVKGKHPFNKANREAERKKRMMTTGRYWAGVANATLYSVPVVLERKEGNVNMQGFVRAFWDGNSECKLQFPEKKKGKLALPSLSEMLKNVGKSDNLDALYLSDLDHNIYFYVDADKAGNLSKKYLLE